MKLKIARLPLQAIAILLQIYFIIETIRLYLCGYVIYLGEPIESAWFSMLFTLGIVVVCEIVSFIDAILFILSTRSTYSVVCLALILTNASLFITMAYYSVVGTILCMSFYAVLFILRLINLVRNCTDIRKHLKKKPTNRKFNLFDRVLGKTH